MGCALGAVVQPQATLSDCMAADVIIAVKRIPGELLRSIRKSGKPWVYDIVDAYPQPTCSTWSRDQSIEWVHDHITQLAPHAVIWPNQRMASDCDIGLASSVFYHHHRPNITINQICEQIETVGYEGSARYLAEWKPVIEQECARRGWRFVVNPRRLCDIDIVLALRGKEFSGYPQKNWKSNVKLANAQGSGTPAICSRECGYIETQSGAEQWADSAAELIAAFDALESVEARRSASAVLRKAAPSIGSIASEYLVWLQSKF